MSVHIMAPIGGSGLFLTHPLLSFTRLLRLLGSRVGIYAMAECHIDDKMAGNIYALRFM